MTIVTTATLADRGIQLVIDLITAITAEAERRGKKKAAALIRQATARLDAAREQIHKAQALLPDCVENRKK